jgi:outer membrane protein assembly factor BamB
MVLSTAILFVVIALVTPSSPLPAAEPAPAADLSTREGEDWGTFLGPSGTGSSSLAGIASPWEANGPRVVWQAAIGEGYCAPAVAGGRAFLFDRVANRLRLRAVEAETGRPLWEAGREVAYTDSFGYDGGPRAQPVVAGHRVLTFGPDGRLECRAIIDGSLLWEVDTSATYHVVQNFFGVGTAPLVVGPLRVGAEERTLVVVQVGGSREGANPAAPERLDLVKGLDSGLVAFDIGSGAEVWRATNQLASYSVPVLATIGGRPLILAWMRDELVAVEPATGKLIDSFRWRSDELFSVVAASPVVSGDQVLLSECYGPGSVLLALENDSFREVRRDKPGARPRQALKTHWNTPVLRDGYAYGSSGRNAGDAQLVCVNWNTGVVGWSEGGLGRSSVTLVDDHLLILGEYGDLVLARATPEKYEEVSRVRPLDAASGRELLAPPCWAAPVIARGLVFVRGTGRVVCLDLKPTR